MSPSYADALGDYDAAIERLRASRWEDDAEQRRSLSEVMGSLFRLRNRAHAAAGGHMPYFDVVSRSRPGQIVEAIVMVRGARDHDFMRDVEPRAGYVYPGENTFPSPELFADDRNLFWRARDNLDYELGADESEKYRATKVGYYDTHLAGVLVLHTLRAGRLFFAAEGAEPVGRHA